MNQIMPFQYDGNKVRTIIVDGEPWFVARDVCDILELGDTGRAVSRLEDDECTRIEIDHPQNPEKALEVYAVNEPGLYSLILGSRKPEAKAFKRWITHEVIPQIRKTGSYSLPVSQAELSLQIAQCLVSQERQIKALEAGQERQNQTIQNIKDTLAPTDKAWRKWVMDELNKTAYARGGEYREVREESCKLLEERGRCKLSIRVKNLQDRLREQGATKTAVNKINRIDVIEADPRLKEIYSGIIRELSIKHLA